MRYFGGREITEEDLERALVVGMSPHEIRRLERKKGLAFKHSKGSLPPDAEQKKNTSTETYVVPDLSAVNSSDAKAERFSRKEDSEFFMVKDVGTPSLHRDSGIDETPSAVVENNLTSDRSGVSDANNVSGENADDNSDNGRPPNGKADNYYAKNDGIAYPKHKSKLSLLGHGPHGKQVVDYLLKEYGDDGIRQFCQRWRQVFVKAVHPRFLPAGWDITHRYNNHNVSYVVSYFSPSARCDVYQTITANTTQSNKAQYIFFFSIRLSISMNKPTLERLCLSF